MYGVSPPPSTETPTPTTSEPSEWQGMLPALAAGVGLALAVVLGSGYLLSRPCVLGSCETLADARARTQTGMLTLEAEKTTDALGAARRELADAIAELEDIPRWSRYSPTARTLLAQYRSDIARLDRVIEALSLGAIAAEKSQNPPHPEVEWKRMARLWEAAIAQLEAIDADNPAYELVQIKIEQYRDNLASVRDRLALERTAQHQLEVAQSAVDMARVRQNMAADLVSWRLVAATWQTAIAALRRVPEGTTAHNQARDLLQNHQSELAAATDRKTQEQIAANFYERAVRLGDEARQAEAQQQWARAANQWQQALNLALQVPANTSVHDRAQTLAVSFSTALQQVGEKQYLASLLQRARVQLQRVCNAQVQICVYSVTPDAIVVRLTEGYRNRIRQTAQLAAATGDDRTQDLLQEHFEAIADKFREIGSAARRPVKVYDPEGNVIGSYAPR